MFTTKFFTAAAASLSLIASSTAVYNPASNQNLAMYYGQGDTQERLSHYCDQASIDVIPIGFINVFPPKANGLVAQNFGNNCWNGNYTSPGYNGSGPNATADFNYGLYRQCPKLQEDIYYCQTKTKKKILLSLGGDVSLYDLNSAADGIYLADWLWGAYGPYNASWVDEKIGHVRPLDRGYNNDDPTMKIDIDGFDFDIEHTSKNAQTGYIACIKRLRENFTAYKLVNKCSKDYIISGSPQCYLPEANMGDTILGAKFDMLWIQFYNNPSCSARNYINKGASGINYNNWVTFVNGAGSQSKGAKLYIGLLGGPKGSASSPGDYLTTTEANKLITAYKGATQFGGVMLWEATVAENNAKYQDSIRGYLGTPTTTVTSSVCSTSTSKAISSSSTIKSSSTISSSSTKLISTSSSMSSSSSSSSKASSAPASTSKTSSSASSTSTSNSSSSSSASSKTSSSSSSSATTSSSSSSSSSSYSSSSSSSSSYSATPISSSTSATSSSYSATPTSTSSSSSSYYSSSTSSSSSYSSSSSEISISSYPEVTPTTSSAISTSTSESSYISVSTTSTSSSAGPTYTPPGTVPSVGNCAYIGCYTEATNSRALTGKTFIDYTNMKIELCASECAGFAFFGVEYGGECYCGDSLNEGSVLAPLQSDCSQQCGGDFSEVCGAGNRLSLYQCTAPVSSTTVSYSPTSSMETSSSTSSVETSTSASETSTTSYSATETSTSIYSPTETPTSSSSIYSATETPTSSSYSPTETPTSSTYSATETSSSSSYSATETPSSSSSIYSPTKTPTSSTYSATETSSSSLATETSSSSSSSYSATDSSSSYSATVTSSSSSSYSATESSSSSYSATVTSSSTSYSETSTSAPITSSSSSTYSTIPPYSNSTSSGYSNSTSYTMTPTTSTTETITPSSSKTSGGISSSTSVSESVSVTYTPSSSKTSGGVVSSTSASGSPTYTPSSSKTSGGVVSSTCTSSSGSPTYTPSSKTSSEKVTSTSKPHYTTSTVYSTSVYTVTSCAPTVTNCPIGHVTTKTIAVSTTVCPVTETEKPTSAPSPKPTKYTTSTVYTTKIYTVTSCAPSVTNCPVGHVTTEIVKLYTTVCPVTEAEPTSTPVAQYTPINSYTVKPATSDISYTTLKSTTTQYRTVKLIKSTATVYAVPSSVSVKSEAPYPTGPATSGKVLGTASPSLSVVINKVTSSAEGVVSYTPTPKPTTFTGGASGVRGGMGMVVAVVMGGLFMIL